MAEVTVDATDGAARAAADLGVTDDLNEGKIEGSGENGRVQANDVKEYAANKGAGEDQAGAEVGEDGETSPNTDAEDLANEEDDDEDDPPEFDDVQGEKLSPRLAPHLTDTGLDILEQENDDEEIQDAITRERERREATDLGDEADAIDLVIRFAHVMRRPMSRSQIARRSQKLLTDIGIDWRNAGR